VHFIDLDMSITATAGKRIIITGASSGIGRAVALEYARRGARLLLAARREDALRETAAAVNANGGEAHVISVDVTDRDAARRIVALADEKLGGIDTVIMNAGVGSPTFADDFAADEIEQVMEVNFTSAVRMIEAVLPRMRAANAGQIVAVTSLASFRGMPGSSAYNASKGALTILMESLRTELRPTGVTITTVLPGFVRTAMTDQNEFHMPFMLEVDDAARRMVDAIERGAVDVRFPRILSTLVRISTYLPNRLYDWIVRRGRGRRRSDR
jgi:short-subunit dehydrogenase